MNARGRKDLSWMKEQSRKYLESARAKVKTVPNWEKVVIIFIFGALVASFTYGWYADNSKPDGGKGWADQSVYQKMTETLTEGNLPTPHQLHYPIGYPLLGVLPYFIMPKDPFMLVSFALVVGSAVLVYLAVRHVLGAPYATGFFILLFAWDGAARTFNYSSELFAVPWNNQFLFFTLAFFLWLFAKRAGKPASYKILAVATVISGICFLTREETVLFIVPALAAYLLVTRSDWKRWLLVGGLLALCALPQFLVKYAVNGSISSNRKFSYSQVTEHYLQPYLLKRNTWETLIDSEHYGTKFIQHENGEPLFRRGSNNVNRQTLLEAAPWLWLSLPGIVLVLFLRRYPLGLKIFFVISGLVLLFYLSGVNMSAHKLQFHALRYIAPSFIMLNLAAVIVVKEGIDLASRLRNRHKSDGSSRVVS